MPRFTIRHLMIAVCVVAVPLGLYQASEPFLSVVLVLSGTFAVVAWLGFRHHPRLAARVFAASAGGGNLLVAFLGAYHLNMVGFVLMFLISAVTIPLTLGSGSVWAMVYPRRKAVAWTLVLGLGFLPLSMFTSWPLRLAAVLSRPSMNRLANRLVAGESLTEPEWAGLYRIVAAYHEPRNGNVILVTDPDPSGRSGFVMVSDPSQPLGQMYNLNHDVPVGGSWRYQNED
jgi:hypothetical protein